MGARAETTTAISDMAAEIKSSPVVNGLGRRCLQRQLRCCGRKLEREHGQPHGHEYATKGSAAPVHPVCVSSANISAHFDQFCRFASRQQLNDAAFPQLWQA